ncbi:unnamed protein product [Phytophthora lilii]|uniref:Unnamed protein product n=1 Tax=Phytophthora lilii TaxID=2077276 RepID=A0A9W6XVJ9_9STRA|nr:unnamed protein product [Phytophthora lilii]
MSDDLPELGWPSTSVMVPGSNTPLKLRRMVLCTTCFLAESLSAAVLMVCAMVGSSRPSSCRPTTTSAATLRFLTRTSTCGSGRPSAACSFDATLSLKAWDPLAISDLPEVASVFIFVGIMNSRESLVVFGPVVVVMVGVIVK